MGPIFEKKYGGKLKRVHGITFCATSYGFVISSKLATYDQLHQNDKPEKPFCWKVFIHGCITGAVQATFVHPIDLMRRRIMT